MNVSAQGTVDFLAMKALPERGRVVVMVDQEYHDVIKLALTSLKRKEAEKEEKIPVDINIAIHYKKRTLAMNNLLWALLRILAHYYSVQTQSVVPPEDVYDELIQIYAPMKLGIMTGEAIKITSSKMDTAQMGNFIDNVFGHIATEGLEVASPNDILKYWQEFRQFTSDQSILLHSDVETYEAYKRQTVNCEGCGKFLGDENGDPHHIKAKGRGGNYPIELDRPDNLLHLCRACHQYFHSKGWKKFIELHPHSKFKIESAVKKNVEPDESQKALI